MFLKQIWGVLTSLLCNQFVFLWRNLFFPTNNIKNEQINFLEPSTRFIPKISVTEFNFL